MIAFILATACRSGAPEAGGVPSLSPRPVVVKPALRAVGWQNARCNDGSPWGYTIRRTDSPVWVIDLAGGYFCDDEILWCRERNRAMTTTHPSADGGPGTLKPVGLFSTDPALNPTFAHANHVLAHYCSSDLWLGDSLERRPNSADAVGWWFSGRENVRVLTEALREIDHLDDSNPETKILVVGTSAGAAGLVGNLAIFREALPQAARDGRLRGVIDGGWIAPPIDETPIPNLLRWGPIDRACDAQRRQAGTDPKACLYGPSWWPAVRDSGVPMLIATSGLDVTQTPLFGVDTPEEQTQWQQRLRQSLVEASAPWVFSYALPYHTVAFEEIFAKGAPGNTFRDVLDRFWAGDQPEQLFLRYPETP